MLHSLAVSSSRFAYFKKAGPNDHNRHNVSLAQPHKTHLFSPIFPSPTSSVSQMSQLTRSVHQLDENAGRTAAQPMLQKPAARLVGGIQARPAPAGGVFKPLAAGAAPTRTAFRDISNVAPAPAPVNNALKKPVRFSLPFSPFSSSLARGRFTARPAHFQRIILYQLLGFT